MKLHSIWLLGVMFVSPAWSQEAVTHTPVLTPQSFDRTNESIKKIVHDTAAAQSVPIQLSEETPVKRDPAATFKYVPPVEVQPVKIEPPRLPAPALEYDGFLSALLDILLGVEPGPLDEPLITCAGRDNVMTKVQVYNACPVVP